MNREWITQEEGEIEIDLRHVKMQSAQAIRSVTDALVELITNSDDAYRNSGDSQNGKIIVEITRQRGDKAGTMVVKDRAGGLTLDEMKKKILRYGTFSADPGARGYMGRGAKDIVALGNAAFEAIKDNKVHRVELDSDFHCRSMKPVKAIDEDYKAHGLKPGKSGMIVTLEISRNHTVPFHDTLMRDLQRHYALRDILCRREVRLLDAKSGKEDVLRYIQPKGEKVRCDTYEFDSPYQGVKARLELYKAEDELSSDMQEGILITDGWAAYQVTRFASDFDEDPIARRFFGRLECSHIRHLQLEFEENRRQGKKPENNNPVDIVDPNRRRGLDCDNHPFVKKLFEWAEDILCSTVQDARDQESEKETRAASEETKKRLAALSKAVAEHLKEKVENETLTPQTPEEKAILEADGALLNPQFQRIEIGETKRLGYTVLSFGKDFDPENITIEVEGDGLKVDPKKPFLKPQKRDPEKLAAYFEITGIEVSPQVKLSIIHPNELIKPVVRLIEVIESKDPYANLQPGLFFEKQAYTVHHNGTRTLTFLARGRRFRTVNWNSQENVKSSRSEAISILRGGSLNVQKVAKDVWKGEVHVKGFGVGNSGIITLSITTNDGDEVANARVKVVEKENTDGATIKIELVWESAGKWRAEWDRANPNFLKVYAQHPVLCRYLGKQEDIRRTEEAAHFRILLAEIVADKVAQRILEKKIESNPREFEDPHKMFFRYSEEMTDFLPKAHEIMIPEKDVPRTG